MNAEERPNLKDVVPEPVLEILARQHGQMAEFTVLKNDILIDPEWSGIINQCEHVEGGEVTNGDYNLWLSFTFCPKCGVKL